MGELADCVRVQLIDACKCFLANGLLVVSKEEPAELFSLKEVLAVIVRL